LRLRRKKSNQPYTTFYLIRDYIHVDGGIFCLVLTKKFVLKEALQYTLNNYCASAFFWVVMLVVAKKIKIKNYIFDAVIMTN